MKINPTLTFYLQNLITISINYIKTITFFHKQCISKKYYGLKKRLGLYLDQASFFLKKERVSHSSLIDKLMNHHH